MRNQVLDRQKFIAEIMVVFIHIRFPGYFGKIMQVIPRYAVPFFFMITGYFCFSTNREKLEKKLHKRIAWMAEVILVSCTAFFIWKVFWLYFNGQSVTAWLQSFSLREAILIVCLNYTSFIMGHLWYLFALLYIYIFMLFVNRYQLYRTVHKLLPVFFAIQFILNEGVALFGIDTPLSLVSNFFVMGVPNFFFGNYICANEEKILKRVPGKRVLVLTALGGEVLAFASWRIIGQFIGHEISCAYVGTTVTAISIFLYAVKYGKDAKESVIAGWGAKYLLFVYIMHPMVGKTMEGLTRYFLGTRITLWSYLLPVATCVVTLAFGVVFYRILDRNKPVLAK